MEVRKAPSEKPTFQPYWGKPAVRNDRGGRGNVGIIRSPVRASILPDRRLVATLTPRERQVFNLIVRGKINKQIAYELGTTERTVKAHRHQVMEKTQVDTFAGLVSIAERLGMLDLSRNSIV